MAIGLPAFRFVPPWQRMHCDIWRRRGRGGGSCWMQDDEGAATNQTRWAWVKRHAGGRRGGKMPAWCASSAFRSVTGTTEDAHKGLRDKGTTEKKGGGKADDHRHKRTDGSPAPMPPTTCPRIPPQRTKTKPQPQPWPPTSTPSRIPIGKCTPFLPSRPLAV